MRDAPTPEEAARELWRIANGGEIEWQRTTEGLMAERLRERDEVMREAGRREVEEKMEKVQEHLAATFNEGGDVYFLENQICTAIAMLDPDAVLAADDQGGDES